MQPQDITQSQSIECPHWQRVTTDGRCIERWWAGPPVTWLVGGVAAAVGVAAFGLILSNLVGTDAALAMARRNSGRRKGRRR